MDVKNISKLITIVGLTASRKLAAKADALRRFGHVLSAENNSLRMALDVELK